MDRMNGETVTKSRSYKKAISRVGEYLEDSRKLIDLMQNAGEKFADKMPKGIWHELKTVFRLIKAYSRAEYEDVSLKTIVAFIAAIVYLMMPVDLIPDFIPMAGLIDDISLLGYLIHQYTDVIGRYKQWEEETTSSLA